MTARSLTEIYSHLYTADGSLLSPKAFCDLFNVTFKELEVLCGLSPGSFSKRPEKPKQQEVLRKILRIIFAAHKRFSSTAEIVRYLRDEPISELDGNNILACVSEINVLILCDIAAKK